jgi:predicted metal-dependent phosphoesterase TrpH
VAPGKHFDYVRTVLKVELHAHSGDDPIDEIPYSTRQLIDRAALHRYDALAITLHERQLDVAPLASYARQRGITLIPGIERTIEGKHVLLLNFRGGTETVSTFADLARLKEADGGGLVVAPHPFFPVSSCLQDQMDPNAHLFDAVEYNGMFTASLNFNDKGVRWARAHGKPMVGAGDVHRLVQVGTTWTMVDAECTPEAICAAIRAGRIRVEAYPHTLPVALMIAADVFGRIRMPGWLWPQNAPGSRERVNAF